MNSIGLPTQSRSLSDNGSERTRVSRVSRTLMLSTDDSWMPPMSTTNTNEFRFTTCSVPGCSSTSAFSEYGAMTLRAGYSTCTNHTTDDMIVSKVRSTTMTPDTLFVFYDIEVTTTNEIDQLSAVTSTGEHIDLIVKTSTRRNNSPIVGKLRPFVYMLLSTEPPTALRALISWIKTMARKAGSGDGKDSDVVMVAHNGMNHDHVLLLKTMLVWGITPPRWRFADTLPIFKLVVAPGEKATLDALTNKYVPWFQHIHHDGLSDAMAIMHVVTKGVPNWTVACMAFSSSCDEFMVSVGLNTFVIRPALPFPDMAENQYM